MDGIWVKRRSFLVWVGLTALLLILLNLPVPASRALKSSVREAVAPLQRAWSGLALRTREAVSTLRGLGGLAGRNRELEEDALRLRSENRELQAFRNENEQLRALLGFQRSGSRKMLAAEVIARDASGWWETLRLGRGERDGARIDRAVVTPDGLVGRTVEVTPHTTEVLLLSDPSCRVAVEIPRTGSFGIMTGQGARRDGRAVCRVEFLNRNHELREGDAVITSGLGGVFSRGFLVGYVEKVDNGDSETLGLYQAASVLLRADVGGVRHVFVMVDPAEPPPATAPGGEASP